MVMMNYLNIRARGKGAMRTLKNGYFLQIRKMFGEALRTASDTRSNSCLKL
jgi:hypothetical protein